MSNISTAEPAYRNAIESSDSQVSKPPLVFQYLISAVFRRKHYNPPIWQDAHYHNFTVSLELEAECRERDLYGLDMVETEKLLQQYVNELPETLNDCSKCLNGTTEQLCLYFAGIELDNHIQLKSVAVAECPERVTVLKF